MRKIFEMYATGEHTLKGIRETVVGLGLTGQLGRPVATSNVQHALKNPIYYGIIRFKGELYEGKHEPLITKALFDKCQEVMAGKCHAKVPAKEKFPYRGMLRCAECGCFITTEEQKGHHYLRCTKKKGLCGQPYVREEELAKQITEAISRFAIPDDWATWLFAELDRMEANEADASKEQQRRLREELATYDARLNRLLMAHLDQAVSADEYRQAKNTLLLERRKLQETLEEITLKHSSWLEPFRRFITSSRDATYIASGGDILAQRNFFQKIGSNLTLRDRRLNFEPRGAWQLLLQEGFAAQPQEVGRKSAREILAPETEETKKRRGRDSNPRYGKPHTGFRNQLDQPLRHLSVWRFSGALTALRRLWATSHRCPCITIAAIVPYIGLRASKKTPHPSEPRRTT